MEIVEKKQEQQEDKVEENISTKESTILSNENKIEDEGGILQQTIAPPLPIPPKPTVIIPSIVLDPEDLKHKILNPELFRLNSFRIIQFKNNDGSRSGISVIAGKLKKKYTRRKHNDQNLVIQSYRFDKNLFDLPKATEWLNKHFASKNNGILGDKLLIIKNVTGLGRVIVMDESFNRDELDDAYNTIYLETSISEIDPTIKRKRSLKALNNLVHEQCKRTIHWNGLELGVEFEKGEIRHINPITTCYGFIKRHIGADDMQLDCYIGDNLDSTNIYKLTQLKPDGTFDEYKFMIGFSSINRAKKAYLENMPKEFFGKIEVSSLEEIETFNFSGITITDSNSNLNLYLDATVVEITKPTIEVINDSIEKNISKLKALTDKVVAKILVTQSDVENLNDREYTPESLELAVNEAQEKVKLGLIIGYETHPEPVYNRDGDVVGYNYLQNPPAFKVIKLWFENNKVWALAEFFDNPTGLLYSEKIKKGEKVCVSLRALGECEKIKDKVVCKIQNIDGFDIVEQPAMPSARVVSYKEINDSLELSVIQLISAVDDNSEKTRNTVNNNKINTQKSSTNALLDRQSHKVLTNKKELCDCKGKCEPCKKNILDKKNKINKPVIASGLSKKVGIGDSKMETFLKMLEEMGEEIPPNLKLAMKAYELGKAEASMQSQDMMMAEETLESEGEDGGNLGSESEIPSEDGITPTTSGITPTTSGVTPTTSAEGESEEEMPVEMKEADKPAEEMKAEGEASVETEKTEETKEEAKEESPKVDMAEETVEDIKPGTDACSKDKAMADSILKTIKTSNTNKTSKPVINTQTATNSKNIKTPTVTVTQNKTNSTAKEVEKVKNMDENLILDQIQKLLEKNNQKSISTEEYNRIQKLLEQDRLTEQKKAVTDAVDQVLVDGVIGDIDLSSLPIQQVKKLAEDIKDSAKTPASAVEQLKFGAKVLLDAQFVDRTHNLGRFAGAAPKGKSAEILTDNKSWLSIYDKVLDSVNVNRKRYRARDVAQVADRINVNKEFTNTVLGDWDRVNAKLLADFVRQQNKGIRDGIITDNALITSNSDLRNQPIIARVIIQQIFQRLMALQLVQGLGPGAGLGVPGQGGGPFGAEFKFPVHKYNPPSHNKKRYVGPTDPIPMASSSLKFESFYAEMRAIGFGISDELRDQLENGALQLDPVAMMVDDISQDMARAIDTHLLAEHQLTCDEYKAVAVPTETPVIGNTVFNPAGSTQISYDGGTVTYGTGVTAVIKALSGAAGGRPIVDQRNTKALDAPGATNAVIANTISVQFPVATYLNRGELDASGNIVKIDPKDPAPHYAVDFERGYFVFNASSGIAVAGDLANVRLQYSYATNYVSFDLDVTSGMLAEDYYNGLLNLILQTAGTMESAPRYRFPDTCLFPSSIGLGTVGVASLFHNQKSPQNTALDRNFAKSDVIGEHGGIALLKTNADMFAGDRRAILFERYMVGYGVQMPAMLKGPSPNVYAPSGGGIVQLTPGEQWALQVRDVVGTPLPKDENLAVINHPGITIRFSGVVTA